MKASILARHPALRLLVPFAIGIIAAECARLSSIWAIGLMATGTAVYVAMTLLTRDASRRTAARGWWILPIALMAMGVGMATTVAHRPPSIDLQTINGLPAEAVVDDVQRKDFSMVITARMLQPCRAMVLITTRGCDYTLKEGERIRFVCDLSPITNLGNPDEPDYATLMRRKGILYRQHLNDSPAHFRPAQSAFSPKRLRRHLEDAVLNTGTGQLTQQLIIAMLLGDSRLIDPDTRQTFSRAGVAHVLALSGLHVGIIAWLVWLVLFPLDHWRLKKLRLGITLLVLAAFCVMTGMSPSVMRAALMIGMAMCSFILYRRYAPINTLAVAALLILLFAPSQLFNAGFQLSFITVAALLFTFGHITLPRLHPVFNYVIGTLLTTAIATIATFMLSAYYFHTVSLISLPANLLVIPLIPVIILLGMLILVLAAMGLQWSPLNWMADRLCLLLDRINHLMGNLPVASLDNIYVNGFTLLLYMVALALAAWWLLYRKKAILIAAGASLLAMIVVQGIDTRLTPRSGLVIFNDFKGTPIMEFSNGHAIVWIPDYDDDTGELEKQFATRHKSFLAHYRINNLSVVTQADTTDYGAIVKPPFATLGNNRIMAIDDKSTAAMLSHRLPALDIIVLCRHFKTKHLPADATLPAPLIVISGATRNTPAINTPTDHIHDLSVAGAFVRLSP